MMKPAMRSLVRTAAIAMAAMYACFPGGLALAAADSECTSKGGKQHCVPPKRLKETFIWCDTGPDNALSRL